MRVSKEWLEQYITLPDAITPDNLANDITLKSVEVEEVISYAALLDNIVLAEITAIEKHPNADSLYCCAVDNGSGEAVPIVCGGGNLRKGMRVILGMIGAKVQWHGEGELVELKKTKIRGESSHGMICAAEEIGLALLFPQKDEKDIVDVSFLKDVPLGTPIATALEIEDHVLDIENKTMTHRPDLWGHYGLARECSAIYNIPLQEIDTPDIVPGKEVSVSVSVEETTLCPRYMAVVLDNLEDKEAPLWMRKRLALAGSRSINAIVDITNYVMLELGQPLHAFDTSTLASPDIIVRKAQKDEKIIVLGGEQFTLTPDMLVIADKGKAVALAGIKGGENTGVTASTTAILLEAAHFSSQSVRRTSSALGLRTDASARFEKNLDPLLVEKALKRAVALFVEIFPDVRVVSAVCDEQSFSVNKPVITVSLADISAMMGCDMEEKFVTDTLTKLGFGVTISDGVFSVSVPSWRATGDIAIPEDIIEEIARMYGYGNVPKVLPSFPIAPSPASPLRDTKKRVVEILSRVHGFTEHYSYAFVSPDWLDRLNIDKTKHIALANPLAKDKPLIRRSIVPNMLESVEKNFHRFDEIALFELGPVFYSELEGAFEDTTQKERLPRQEEVLGVVYGSKNEDTPFFAVSDAVLDLFARLGVADGSLKKVEGVVEGGFSHPGRMAEIFAGDTLVGRIAEMHPTVQNAVGIPHRVAFAEIFIERMLEHTGEVLDYAPITPFPVSQRDVAFTVAKNVVHNDIVKTISSCSDLITSVELFDVYEGEYVEEGQKSMAYHVVYGSGDRTLTNEEVSEVHKHVVSMLSKQYDATVRT